MPHRTAGLCFFLAIVDMLFSPLQRRTMDGDLRPPYMTFAVLRAVCSNRTSRSSSLPASSSFFEPSDMTMAPRLVYACGFSREDHVPRHKRQIRYRISITFACESIHKECIDVIFILLPRLAPGTVFELSATARHLSMVSVRTTSA